MNKESNSEIQNVMIQALFFAHSIIISYFNFNDVLTIFLEDYTFVKSTVWKLLS